MKQRTAPPQTKATPKGAPPTPYTRGFEHFCYGHEYANPYAVGSARWWQYDFGNADARIAQKEAALCT